METHAIKCDILFAEKDKYAVFRLKCSKTNIDDSGLQLIMKATGDTTFLIVYKATFMVSNV